MRATHDTARSRNGRHLAGASIAESVDDVRHRLAGDLARADRFTRRLGRERPLLAAGLALTAGFVIGRLVARHG